ncbi:MAG: ParB-like nuclease domain-containing protein, partial [Gemmatimonadetes bacterium]|nr:ParB-like nuclease domain-containing protein [Gemmatimonadota bacterium]
MSDTAAFSETKYFRIDQIRPNPFRAIDSYPLDERKVEALRKSIRATSFWDNLVGRVNEEDGKPELAYGHHRLEALRQELGEASRILITIKDLSDAQMLKIMLWENMEQWQTDALGDQANIRALVTAYADGAVQLPPPKPKTPRARLRYAPSFRQGYVAGRDRQDRPYTSAT